MAISTYFQNIADAIREKTGGSGLITPGDMPEEIRNIPTGGNTILTPDYYDLPFFYVNSDGDSLYCSTQALNRNDIYEIKKSGHYILFKGSANIGNRFRAGIFQTNAGTITNIPTAYTLIEQSSVFYNSNDTAEQSGYSIRFNTSQEPYKVKYISANYIGWFLTVTKNNNGTLNDKIYVVRLEDLIGE